MTPPPQFPTKGPHSVSLMKPFPVHGGTWHWILSNDDMFSCIFNPHVLRIFLWNHTQLAWHVLTYFGALLMSSGFSDPFPALAFVMFPLGAAPTGMLVVRVTGKEATTTGFFFVIGCNVEESCLRAAWRKPRSVRRDLCTLPIL